MEGPGIQLLPTLQYHPFADASDPIFEVGIKKKRVRGRNECLPAPHLDQERGLVRVRGGGGLWLRGKRGTHSTGHKKEYARTKAQKQKRRVPGLTLELRGFLRPRAPLEAPLSLEPTHMPEPREGDLLWAFYLRPLDVKDQFKPREWAIPQGRLG